MISLKSFITDQWYSGQDKPTQLFNPATETVIAVTDTSGIDTKAVLDHARNIGGPTLRSMSFAERGALLKAMSRALYAERERLIDVSCICNGATRKDSKFDIDGATGTLSYYAKLGTELGDGTILTDGESERLTANARFVGQHVFLPRPGVAIHINAFNFPAWGTFEKIACAFLAGMPVVTKPATATALLTYEMIKIIVDAEILPAGVLQFIAGSARDLLDYADGQDVIAFTGSADTAHTLRQNASVTLNSARFNAEADSLNAAILGPDVEVGDDIWYTYIKNIVTDMTQKAGQKCTAIRRIIAPEAIADDLQAALVEELSRITVGNPAHDGIRMGPLASAAQLRDVRDGIDELAAHSSILTGGSAPIAAEGVPDGKGYFVAPTLLRANDGADDIFHSKEVFGPCATILTYDGSAAQAVMLMAKGKGCLVSSVYSNHKKWISEALLQSAVWTGRLQLVSAKVADSALPPGMVLPNQLHGGPGRAGGGEELGGMRGLHHYWNRTCIQGDTALLGKLLK
ncbi:MAG: 3,4-dehydroadipyl-CoA semialdehyde dehydrogenase [Myxococcota bacterium]|nr:3,4-dehydroadipyl-CoA semialdehyde dehydrogenase [Myxococcota bacterium]